MQRLAAGREDLELWTRLQQLLGQLGTRRHQMFAIVQNYQELPILDVLNQGLHHRMPRLFLDPERRGYRLRYEARIHQGRKFDEPHSVRIVIQDFGCNLQRQSRFAKTTDAKQRQQPCIGEQLLDLGEFVLAADESGHLLWQIIRRRFERTQRREILTKFRVQHLVDKLRTRQAAQPHCAEVAQRHAFGQPLADERDYRVRQQDLSAMRGIHDSRGAVDYRSVVVVVTALIGADMHSAAHVQCDTVGDLRVVQRKQELYRGVQRIERIGEHGVNSVTGRLDDRATVRLNGLTAERIVTCQRGTHARGLQLPQPRAALYIGK